MKRLVSTVGLPKEDWLRYRKRGLTGTDAGAITGMNPYVSAFQIYQDKTSDEIEDKDNESMRQGRDLEEYVARRFSEETGKKVRHANAIYQSEENDFMLADFDRLIVGEKAGLECKTVNAYSADKWKNGEIPLHYQMQVQHYLAVSGYDSWYIAALIFGKEFLIRKIDRDEELIRNLVIIEKRFWEKNVLKRVVPQPDGSSDYSDMLGKMYAGDKEQTIQLFGVQEELRRRDEIEELLEKLNKEKTMIEQDIKAQMKDAVYAESGDYFISWMPSTQQRIDTKRLKEEEPDVYTKYLKDISSRRFQIKYKPAA